MTLTSELTCPHCGARRVEEMPTESCLYIYECSGCGSMLKPKHGDCCVFCSYGSVPCPPMQAVPVADAPRSSREAQRDELSFAQANAQAAILLFQAVLLALLEKGILGAHDVLTALSDVVEACHPPVGGESSDGAATVVGAIAQTIMGLHPSRFRGSTSERGGEG